MLSRFFIDRPIFANVIAIITIVFGLVTVRVLPVEQYPNITPPTVQVTTSYPGANAQVVADTVASPIEEQVNGVEHMLYMSSVSAANGSYSLTVTFEVGTDLDIAQVLVQNRVAIAQPLLPDEVRRQGVTTKKQSTNIVMFAVLTSPEERYDALYLSNYATLRVRDELARLDGVGDVQVFGAADYSMRIWLDPPKLRARNLTAGDVLDAIREQNVQVAAGQIGQPPVPDTQTFQYTVNTLGRLSDVGEFEDIIIKTEGARVTRLRDIARVELGGEVYDIFFQQNGKPAAGIAVFQLPGANALDVATKVRAAMEEIKPSFPQGLDYNIPFDTTLFVRQAIHEVYMTLFEAGILVLIVILLFLQSWRALLVPATTVPVTIIGAFAGMAAVGFSVNLLTLFGLVLAIGIVVDDAIIIVENASHHIEADKLSPRDATIKAMEEMTGPVLGITCVLMAVFLPTAFLGGITGQLYRQFALTIAVTALISAVNALTLKPAQCAAYLRPVTKRPNAFFRAFNRGYERVERFYTGVVQRMVVRPFIMMGVFAVLLAVTMWGFTSLPTGFLPTEDQGYVIAGVQLPDAASQPRMRRTTEKINEIIASIPGVADWNTVGGNSILDGTSASNAATFYIVFEPWDQRTDPDKSQDAILHTLRTKLGALQDGQTFAFPPPAIRGVGVSGGFQMQIQDRGNVGLPRLQQVVEEMLHDGGTQSGIGAINSTFRAGVPQLFADVDRTKAKTLNIPLTDVFGTLQTYLGSAYVNDFNLFGRTYQVRVQAEPSYRVSVDDITRLQVRNAGGQMVPLGTLVDVEDRLGPQIVPRYNLYPSASITGEAARGYSSGDALSLMEQMANSKLSTDMGFEWTGISLQEKTVGNEAILIFALAVLLVFLVLAAQYESWTSPAAVILVVPLALLGTVIAVAIRGMDNNVYTQIGVVLLIALASKNAILIVEFAREQRERGLGIAAAAVEAARLRFRPILMTSFAFILGVYPLVIAKGAGAASRQALGTAVFGGMITSTLLAVLFVPVFYVVMQTLSERWAARKHTALEAPLVDP
ncbi:MAG TPA: multidrug efflux RND transporter permease subunit [Candidatus Binatia bacterium]|jgi:HAE1 family hydrophobic/amphiphilic exporter-1|nr:multidrug efflux RND transporter permease subunit [Candidatus Binatia bacterium]